MFQADRPEQQPAETRPETGPVPQLRRSFSYTGGSAICLGSVAVSSQQALPGLGPPRSRAREFLMAEIEHELDRGGTRSPRFPEVQGPVGSSCLTVILSCPSAVRSVPTTDEGILIVLELSVLLALHVVR